MCLILVSTEMLLFLLKLAVSECEMKRTKQLRSICPCLVICKGEVTLLIFCDQQLLNQFCKKKRSNRSWYIRNGK